MRGEKRWFLYFFFLDLFHHLSRTFMHGLIVTFYSSFRGSSLRHCSPNNTAGILLPLSDLVVLSKSQPFAWVIQAHFRFFSPRYLW